MKRLLIILAFSFSIYSVSSQEMDIKTLDNIFATMSDTIQGQSGRWQFVIEDVMFICIADTAHNRMRIISPIADANTLDEDQKTLSLLANFHTALDVKYAISDDVLWSAFIHPLKELTVAQVKDAVSQVYYANITFGTTYTSTDLVFPGKAKKEAKQIKKSKFKKKT
ncbi:MAG: hypothetical protein IMY67_11495 [Bacteroidetes bacterium]|nr:hypothetical protein [Bacteroidota bacterium]